MATLVSRRRETPTLSNLERVLNCCRCHRMSGGISQIRGEQFGLRPRFIGWSDEEKIMADATVRLSSSLFQSVPPVISKTSLPQTWHIPSWSLGLSQWGPQWKYVLQLFVLSSASLSVVHVIFIYVCFYYALILYAFFCKIYKIK